MKDLRITFGILWTAPPPPHIPGFDVSTGGSPLMFYRGGGSDLYTWSTYFEIIWRIPPRICVASPLPIPWFWPGVFCQVDRPFPSRSTLRYARSCGRTVGLPHLITTQKDFVSLRNIIAMDPASFDSSDGGGLVGIERLPAPGSHIQYRLAMRKAKKEVCGISTVKAKCARPCRGGGGETKPFCLALDLARNVLTQLKFIWVSSSQQQKNLCMDKPNFFYGLQRTPPPPAFRVFRGMRGWSTFRSLLHSSFNASTRFESLSGPSAVGNECTWKREKLTS